MNWMKHTGNYRKCAKALKKKPSPVERNVFFWQPQWLLVKRESIRLMTSSHLESNCHMLLLHAWVKHHLYDVGKACVSRVMLFQCSSNVRIFSALWLYSKIILLGIASNYLEVTIRFKSIHCVERWCFRRLIQLLLAQSIADFSPYAAIKHCFGLFPIFRNFDLIFLMSYDLHGTWDGSVDMHAKLYPTSTEVTGKGIFNTVCCGSHRIWTFFNCTRKRTSSLRGLCYSVNFACWWSPEVI